jgi:hypothetical protein
MRTSTLPEIGVELEIFKDGMWRSLVAHLTGGQGVAGSNPVIPTNFQWSIPVTWVTVHSGDIGNTFGPNGFSMGSSLQASSSK